MLGASTFKKIVIVSYATYPANSPRNLRTNELAKELARQGHDVTLYVLTGNYNYEIYEKETKVKVRSLGKTFFFSFNHDKGITEPFIVKFIRKIAGKFLEFPFIELALNTYNVLKQEKRIDLLITIARPYPIHWGTALYRSRYKKRLANTVWVADCGDPYMGNTFQKKPFYFKYIEKWFCREADYLTIPIEEARKAYYPEFSNKIRIIPQGFNFNELKIAQDYKKNLVPKFIYAGIFYQNLRDPRPFLDYLLTLKLDFKFIIYTKNSNLLSNYIDKFNGRLEVLSYIPREDLIYKMSKADFLVNFENPSLIQSPSKLIDYALSKRPILSLNTNEKINTEIINQFLDGKYSKRLYVDNIEQYNIEKVAKQFMQLCN